MIEAIGDINGIVGIVLAAIIGGLFKMWATIRRIKAEAATQAETVKLAAEAENAKQRQEWHRELYSEMHLWRNKFQAMENKLELVRSERETLGERVKGLQVQVDTQQAEIKSRDRKIAELEKQIDELERRLMRYEPENIQQRFRPE